MQMTGLEPARLSTLVPKTSAATNYATSATPRHKISPAIQNRGL